jgi:hypothetical protein
MTPEERSAKFAADVEATRPKVKPRRCPVCGAPGVYTGMSRGQHDLYQVVLQCEAMHGWVITVGTLEAHAMRPRDPPPPQPPLVPDKVPVPVADGTSPPLTPPAAAPGAPLCGTCSDPVGGKYYAGVPTARGKLDLCMKCWLAWTGRKP